MRPKLMFVVKLFAYLLLIMGAISLLLFLFQKKIIYQPTREWEGTPSEIGLDYEDLFLDTSDSVKISAWYIKASDEKDSKTIVFCHGNAGNISHRLYSIMQFHKLGCNVLIFDYRGYGKSEGTPSEVGTYIDAETVYEYALKQTGDEKKLVLFGRSLGGAVAAEIAKRRNPAGLILESTFTSVPDMASYLYPFLPARYLCLIRYDTFAKLGQIKCPVLVVHSPDDEVIPYSMGRKLFETAKEPKHFLEISGPHNEGFILSGAVYEGGLAKFLSGLK